MPCAFNHNSHVPVSCPLHRLRNLAFICSVENIRGEFTKTIALRLQEFIHSGGQTGVVRKQWCADGLWLVSVEDARGPVGLYGRAGVW